MNKERYSLYKSNHLLRRNGKFLQYKRTIFVIAMLFCTFGAEAFAASMFSGTVKDTEGKGIPYSTVILNPGKHGAKANSRGIFKIKNLKSGKYELSISSIGYKAHHEEITIEKDQDLKREFTLEEDESVTETVTVFGVGDRKEITEVKTKGVPVAVIDGKSLAGRGTTITEVLNHQTGVKLRKTGGVGTSSQVNIRGMEGNRVKIYMDGSPLNTADGSFSINDIPVQFIDRIEIYKGIIPPEYGGDGLGSAINVVTLDKEKSFVDVSYERQSYNANNIGATWKQFYPSISTAITLYANYVTADNDYTIESPYVPGLKIKRDHDALKMFDYAISLDYRGSYFDKSSVEIIGYMNQKEVQGIQQNIRYALNKGNSFGASPDFEKAGFLTPNLDLKLTGTILYSKVNMIDTATYIYDFYGNVYKNTYAGEIGSIPNNSEDYTMDYQYNLNLKYHLVPKFMDLNVNNNLYYHHLNATDTAAGNFIGRDFSDIKSNIFNLVTSFSVENHWFDQTLTTLFTGRLYNYAFNGNTVDLAGTAHGMEDNHTDISNSYFGYNAIFKYELTPTIMLKLAFEHNYRLPKYEEALGDRTTILVNTKIRPEQANNYNFGVMYDLFYDVNSRVQVDANVYCTDVTDMMHLVNSGGYTTYQNLGSALLYGVDGEIKWDINQNWYTSVNATYQISEDRAKTIYGSSTPSLTYKMQIPHIPILYFNWTLDYREENLFGGHGQYTRIYYEGSFTDEYYYGYELSKTQDYKIPATTLHTLGVEYGFFDRKLLLSAECHNVFDAEEITNYNFPLAGRTFIFKVRLTTLGQ